MNEKRGRSKLATEVDDNLRRVYEDMLNDEVPDRFTDLLERLKRGEPVASKDSDSSADEGQQ